MSTATELWDKIQRKALDIRAVYIKRGGIDTLVAIVAVIRHKDKPNEYWVGETVDMSNFTKVERICEY